MKAGAPAMCVFCGKPIPPNADPQVIFRATGEVFPWAASGGDAMSEYPAHAECIFGPGDGTE